MTKENRRVVLRWLIACTAMLVIPLVISSCSTSNAKADSKHQTSVTYVTSPNTYDYNDYAEVLVNGRHCIVISQYHGGGISCDWSPK